MRCSHWIWYVQNNTWLQILGIVAIEACKGGEACAHGNAAKSVHESLKKLYYSKYCKLQASHTVENKSQQDAFVHNVTQLVERLSKKFADENSLIHHAKVPQEAPALLEAKTIGELEPFTVPVHELWHKYYDPLCQQVAQAPPNTVPTINEKKLPKDASCTIL